MCVCIRYIFTEFLQSFWSRLMSVVCRHTDTKKVELLATFNA